MSEEDKNLIDKEDLVEYKEAIKEAWAIINVFNMMALDEGEAYDRATFWLHEWEHLRPNIDTSPNLTEKELYKLLHNKKFPMDVNVIDAPDYTDQDSKIRYEQGIENE